MTKQEIIEYMYENHVQGDFKIEEMAEDLSQPEQKTCLGCIHENKRGWKIDICGGCVRNASDYYEELRGDSDEGLSYGQYKRNMS